MRFRYLYICRELNCTFITAKNKCAFIPGGGRTCIKIDTHQSLFPCPITKRMFLGGIDCNTGFRTHQKTLVLTWKNCINIVRNQRTVISTILMDKLFLINVINKESGSTGTDIQDTVFSLV